MQLNIELDTLVLLRGNQSSGKCQKVLSSSKVQDLNLIFVLCFLISSHSGKFSEEMLIKDITVMVVHVDSILPRFLCSQTNEKEVGSC